jgi:hypothetical protein
VPAAREVGTPGRVATPEGLVRAAPAKAPSRVKVTRAPEIGEPEADWRVAERVALPPEAEPEMPESEVEARAVGVVAGT